MRIGCMRFQELVSKNSLEKVSPPTMSFPQPVSAMSLPILESKVVRAGNPSKVARERALATADREFTLDGFAFL